MSTSLAQGDALAEVITFPTTRRKPRTLIFRAAVDQADVHRHLGINDSLPLTELHRVLSISFGLSEEQTPWSFHSDDAAVDVQECVHQYLSEPEDQLLYRWGLWTITLETIDSYVRDAGTPDALCIGGSGALGHDTFNVAEINAQLTGEATIEAVLDSVREPVRDLIERSQLYDSCRSAASHGTDPSGGAGALACRRPRAPLPLEHEAAARDAFWSCVLALSTLADAAVGGKIIEETMAAIGWTNDNGDPLSATHIRGACARSPCINWPSWALMGRRPSLPWIVWIFTARYSGREKCSRQPMRCRRGHFHKTFGIFALN